MSLRSWHLAFCLLVFVSTGFANAAAQTKRVALVVGNAAYRHVPELSNPANDAAEMSAVLEGLGFRVVQGRDLDEPEMRRVVKAFADELTGADIGLFFYAGHGLQVNGHNYLVPIDARLESAAGLDLELVRLDVIQRTMEHAAKTNVIFLDACRDNPLSRNLARAMGTRSAQIGNGLAAVESSVGTLISFSTQPGNFAIDGKGRNSPFTESLVKQLRAPKEDLSTLLIQVRNDVMVATNDRQVPWEHSALRSKFYFASLPQKTEAGPTYEHLLEQTFWDSVKDSESPAVLSSYLDRYPDGRFTTHARTLIRRHEERLKAEAAKRQAELKRREEVRAAAEARRLEEEERAARQAVLAEERKRAASERSNEEIKRLGEDLERRKEALKKALEEARIARNAAEAAEQERRAAVKAEEKAKVDARKATATVKPADSGVKSKSTADSGKCRNAAGWVLPCSMMKDGAATRMD